jgi:hypothetical protein
MIFVLFSPPEFQDLRPPPQSFRDHCIRMGFPQPINPNPNLDTRYGELLLETSSNETQLSESSEE